MSAGAKVTTRAAAKSDSDATPTLQSLDDKLNSILVILEKNTTDIWDIKREQKDLGNSIELCHVSIDDIKSLVGEQKKQIEKCEEDVIKVKEENATLSRKCSILENKMNALEQYSHRNNLIVYGIPEGNPENMFGIMRRLATALQFPNWSDSLIDAVHRMGQGTSKGLRPIIIKFISRLDRDVFLQKRKVRRNLKASDLGYSSEDPVYVNESLTPGNRELLRLTREAAKQKNYSQVWTANCNIYVRKEKGRASVIKISSVQDVNAL